MHIAFSKPFFLKYCLSGVLLLIVSGCSGITIPEKEWHETIPEYVPAVIIPEQGADLSAVMRSEYIPFFEDLSTSPIAIVTHIENVPSISLLLKGMAIFPTRSDDWKPLWIAEAEPNLLRHAASYFEKDYAENSYVFSGVRIHIFHTEAQNFYAVQLNEWILISESSYAIEESLRTYLSDAPSIDIQSSEMTANSLVLNTPWLDRWLAQAGAPRYRDHIRDVFKGSGAGIINISRGGDDTDLTFSGTLPLTGERTSLIQSVSHADHETTLDQYIPDDAAAFGLFHHPADPLPPSGMSGLSVLDSLLLSDTNLYREIAETLHPSFAWVAFPASGFLSVGESLYLRQLSDPNALSLIMQRLARDGYVNRNNDMYTMDSEVLADLLGGSLADYDYFSLSITYHAAAFSQRPGLTSRVRTDRSRRRVMFYNDTYTGIRANFPDNISAFFYAKGDDFLNYLQPVLSPVNNVSVITSQFDVAALSLNLDSSGHALDFNMRTFRTQESDQPYREHWVFPLDGAELTSPPLITNLESSNRHEILFATDDNQIHALAADGTPLFQTSTGSDTPIGRPVVFDWYGNNQNAILIAAGNKIYAWNNGGVPLPNFPIVMDEQISAPLQLGDVSRDGRAELIVATEDRHLHVLNGRGENISGWPQLTNSRIETQPVFKQVDGFWSIWAYAKNGLFAWNTNGNLRTGFPVFIDSPFKGTPLFHNDNIIAAAADGHIYSIGEGGVFADSLSRQARIETAALGEEEINDSETERERDTDTMHDIRSLYVANSPLLNTPLIETLTIRNEEGGSMREEMIITQSSNGSVFLFNTQGQLRMTQTMGQPGDDNHQLFLYDINRSGSPEVIALAGFGRLFAWNSFTGERFQNLPTSAMRYPIFTNIFGSGNAGLIAQTREGLRCWTITTRN